MPAATIHAPIDRGASRHGTLATIVPANAPSKNIALFSRALLIQIPSLLLATSYNDLHHEDQTQLWMRFGSIRRS
jgi:hypothetical protein